MSLSKINPTKTKAWKALLKKKLELDGVKTVSYTHLRAHET